MRFCNEEVNTEIEDVLEAIYAALPANFRREVFCSHLLLPMEMLAADDHYSLAWPVR